MESKDVKIKMPQGPLLEGRLSWGEDISAGSECLIVKIEINEVMYVSTGETFFDALIGVRKDIEQALGGLIQCYGGLRNVYPSPMVRSMGEGRKAYKLKLNKPAKMADLVDIFEVPVESEFDYATVEEQLNFYSKWVASL